MHTTAIAVPVAAKVYGIPLEKIPSDLYIPPEALEVFLEAFEGPLDLLLYLIRKANIDILDIPMAQITTQYVRYVEELKAQRLELGAEYLLMAAMLVDIKARMLLPRPTVTQDEEEAEDPRAELVRRLLMYEKMREAAIRLNALSQVGRDFFWIDVEKPKVPEKLPTITVQDVLASWISVLQRAKMVTHHQVKRIILSVREHMGLLLRRLIGGRQTFQQLLSDTPTQPHLIVMFLALLELMKEGLAEASQEDSRAPIYVNLTSTNDMAHTVISS